MNNRSDEGRRQQRRWWQDNRRELLRAARLGDPRARTLILRAVKDFGGAEELEMMMNIWGLPDGVDCLGEPCYG